jgi:hypothetical protein
MEESQKERAARHFSQAADALVNACRELEQCGIQDEPVEQLLQALEGVTRNVHEMVPPPERVQIEPADVATMGCRIAAQQENGQQ